MIRKFILGAAVAALTSPAFAGYVATTGYDLVDTPGTPPVPQIGDTFATPPGQAGTFTAYLPNTPLDPQLTGADLAHYRYTLDGAISSLNLTTGEINYTGTYEIYYDLNNDGTMNGGDPSVSTGTFAILAQFAPLSNNAALTGTLTQTAGPSNPAFSDLSYGGFPVVYNGSYTGDNPYVSGHIQGTLTQAAPAVPEPASLSLLALSALTLLRRRK